MIRVGTRGSALALAQANWVAARIGEAELITVTTSGDRGERLADKSRWTSELERALLAGEVDVAVHSAKDVPGELAAGTEILFVPEREDPSDAICGAGSLHELSEGARVGTSSLRRAAQLRAVREDLRIVELRGNLDTRLRRLAEGAADAIVVATAGLRRLGRERDLGGVLGELLPAPGQGALIVQARAGDPSTEDLASLAHAPSQMAVAAERAFAYGLGASCHTPLGALAVAGDEPEPASAGHVRLRGWIGLPDGSEWIADEVVDSPEEAGSAMAERMISAGAMDLLARAEEMATA